MAYILYVRHFVSRSEIQDGRLVEILFLKCVPNHFSDVHTMVREMVTPRAGANKLKGSATAVRPAVEAGVEKLIRETWRTRLVRVTVTQREKVNGVTETCTARHVETTETTETREIEGEVKETKHEHTHMVVVEDNGGELTERVGTQCRQLDGLLQERGEGVCPLEATHDQVSSVVPSGVEGPSAVDGCTESLGGMEAPGALEVTRIPSVIVPVCVVKGVSTPPCVSGVVTSVPECVLPSAPCVKEAVCV